MKRLISALGLLVLVGCGQNAPAAESTPEISATPAPATTTVAAAGCTASGLDAMTVLANFQLEMDSAQKAGKLTVDQLIAARNKLFDQTQAAAKTNDWTAYCKSIDDMRTELAL